MRKEYTHASSAKTLVNSHGQLIHISLDGQYHPLGNGRTLTNKQLEEIGMVINKCGGQWDHPLVKEKIQVLTASDAPKAGAQTESTSSEPVTEIVSPQPETVESAEAIA